MPCRHLHTDGRPCGSPALRGEPFCFHHHAARRPMPQRETGGFATPQLPAPDDFLAIQRGLGEVLRLLALDKLTDRRAQTLLHGLAAASANLARHHRREEKLAAQPTAPAPVTAYVNHPTHGTLAPHPNENPRQDPSQAEDADTIPPTAPVSRELPPIPDTLPEVAPSPEPGLEPTPEAPLPDPIPLLTPDPSPLTSYDEAKFFEIHARCQTIFTEQRQRFEHQKSLELEALYEDRLREHQADAEARLQTQLAQLTRLAQIPIQQNQDLTAPHEKEQIHLALAS